MKWIFQDSWEVLFPRSSASSTSVAGWVSTASKPPDVTLTYIYGSIPSGLFLYLGCWCRLQWAALLLSNERATFFCCCVVIGRSDDRGAGLWDYSNGSRFLRSPHRFSGHLEKLCPGNEPQTPYTFRAFHLFLCEGKHRRVRVLLLGFELHWDVAVGARRDAGEKPHGNTV